MNNVNNIDYENIYKNICKKYNKPYKSIYSWNSYIKVARNNGFGDNVEEYFKWELKQKEELIKEENRRKDLYEEFGLEYSTLSWANRLNQIKRNNCLYYDENKTEYENMKFYLENKKKEDDEYQKWFDSLPGNGNKVIKCINCNQYFKSNGIKLCEDCYNKLYIEIECSYPGCNNKITILRSELYDHENNIKNHFCNQICHNKNNLLLNKEKEYCSICGIKMNENERNITSICNNCRKDISNNNIKNLTKDGLCSECGKYNLQRDQNGRGKDIGYGIYDSEWIAEKSIKIKDKNNKITIIPKGTKCGCNCSQKFYNRHNSSEKMKIVSSNRMQSRLNEKQICKNCGIKTYVDCFFFGYECGCHDKFYKEHNQKIALDRTNNIKESLKRLGKKFTNNDNIIDLEDFKNKSGLVIINCEVHETKDIYNYIYNHINEFEKNGEIKIIENSNNQRHFKLNYQLEKNDLVLKNYNDYNSLNVDDFKGKSGIIKIDENIIKVGNVYKYLIDNEITTRNSYIEILLDEDINKYNFYKHIDLILKSFKLNNDNSNFLNVNDFNNLKNVSGVWALWGENKETNERECLTVGQSVDIGKELNWTLRVLANDRLQDLERENSGCTGRWDQIQEKYNNFEYILVAEEIEDFNEREKIEAIYAIQNNSKYWMPSPTQQSNKFLNDLVNN